MAINYAKIFNRRVTPQSQPIPDSTQVRNSNNGYSWQVDDWTRLDRFLILGAEGGTYYVAERELVKQNHDAIVRCIKANGIRAVNARRRTIRPFLLWRWWQLTATPKPRRWPSRTSARSAVSGRTCSTSRSM